MKTLNLQKIIICIALIFIGYFSIYLSKIYFAAINSSGNYAFSPPGYHFSDLKSYLVTTKKVGFLTNKDMSAENNDGHFLMAQFALAPIVLDLNSTNHDFLILDYTNLFDASTTLSELKAKIIYKNNFGIIVAQKNK